MSEVTWLEVVAIAAIAQLAVLPGEKVQFIIAGLATRYHPLLVVGAAGTAFAGWTALEVAVGSALTGAVAGVYLDGATAVLYLLFAVALVRSAPPAEGTGRSGAGGDAGPGASDAPDGELATATLLRSATDGGERGSNGEPADDGDPRAITVTLPFTDRRVPHALGGFLPVFALMALGEFGDKTQLVTFSLAAQFPDAPAAIWTGEMLAILPVSLLNAYAFHRFAHRIDRRRAHLAGAALFAFFALDFALQVTVGFSAFETGMALLTAAVTGTSG